MSSRRIAASVDFGELRGRLERSWRPTNPSALNRAIHLWAVFSLTPYCRASSTMEGPLPPLHASMSPSRSSTGQVSFQAMGPNLAHPCVRSESSPIYPVCPPHRPPLIHPPPPALRAGEEDHFPLSPLPLFSSPPPALRAEEE